MTLKVTRTIRESGKIDRADPELISVETELTDLHIRGALSPLVYRFSYFIVVLDFMAQHSMRPVCLLRIR